MAGQEVVETEMTGSWTDLWREKTRMFQKTNPRMIIFDTNGGKHTVGGSDKVTAHGWHWLV
jgi:ribulose 1,5-bisphosphate carboxylase large subunit-like protein